MTEPRPADNLHEGTADARDRLRGMALSLATGNALVEPSAFDAALSRLQAAVLRDAADRLDRLGLRDLATQELRRMADEAETGGAR
ncbi:hypothetical protein ACFWFV_13890 [Streptomyces diastaticus]|uniref:hypothetical protein n=1 Tax=Streptomyces diastaticus TaxID=1956 RepID=UPI003656DFF4